MKRVYFDHQIFSLQQYGGISRYFCELAAHMKKIQGIHVDIIPWIHQNKHLLDKTGITKFSHYVGPARKTTLPRFFLNSFLFEAVRQLQQPDIVHRTYYGNLNFGKSKYVTTIYDFIPERYPQEFDNTERFINLKRKAILDSDHVICISHATKEDLLSYCPIPESRLSVVHLASSLNIEAKKPENRFKTILNYPKKPFILYVGARSGYKNFDAILAAIAASNSIKKEFAIICFGGSPFTFLEKDRAFRLGLHENIFHLKGDDAVLSALYCNARLFVYPSLYEGFGIPIIEAMSMGCPVACSDIPIFHEVANDAAAMFDPKNTTDIVQTLESVLFSESLRYQLIQKGYINRLRFTWEKAASETVSVYRNLNI